MDRYVASGRPIMNDSSRTNEFLQLLLANHKRIYAFILGIVANYQDAEDIFQQTILIMWSKFDRFERGTSFTSLGATVAKWIKLERVGNDFRASYVTDAAGAQWTAMSWSPPSVTMPAGPVYIGLAVCSHVAGTPTVAQFANITTSNSISGQWQTADIGVAQPSNPLGQLYVTLTDVAGQTKSVLADEDAVFASVWTAWRIPFASFAGVNMGQIKTITIASATGAIPSMAPAWSCSTTSRSADLSWPSDGREGGCHV